MTHDVFDYVNAAFEGAAALFALGTVIKTYIDKDIKGMWVPAAIFFTIRGYYDTYYYWHLGQSTSIRSECFLDLVNTIWVCQILWYTEFRFWRRVR